MGKEKNIQDIYLLASISKGDIESFEQLFHLYYNRLLRFSTTFHKDKAAAEDIVTDVFAKIWQQRASLTEIREPDVYLFTMVKNASLNYLRHNAKMKIIHIDEPEAEMCVEESFYYQPAKKIETKELYNNMQKAIENLPQQCRTIFNMVKRDGLTCRKVAEILNLSPRTVETQIYIAVKKLQKEIQDYALQTESVV